MKNSSKYLILFLILIIACSSKGENGSENGNNKENVVLVTAQEVNLDSLKIPSKEQLTIIDLPEDQWKERLSKEEFYILRKKGTERSFTGKYWDNKKEGIYLCLGCSLPLFSSSAKFKSGTGWPSFYEPLENHLVTEESDNAYGMKRVEVLCARCNGHLGHVFEDGPEPTGLRYCINGNVLNFIKSK